MAETTVLNARIRVSYDTLANWTTHDPVLLPGEIAIVEIVEATTTVGGDDIPAVLMFKVGDGVKKFTQLGWGSALAADVYDWAKAAVKPSYSYSEISATPQMAVEDEMLVFSIKQS